MASGCLGCVGLLQADASCLVSVLSPSMGGLGVSISGRAVKVG